LVFFAYFWIISALYFLIRPKAFLGWLQRKGKRTVRRFLFALLVLAGGGLVSLGLQQSGTFSIVIVFFGTIGLLKGLFFLKSYASEQLVHWTLNLSSGWLRIGALIHLSLGMGLFFLA